MRPRDRGLAEPDVMRHWEPTMYLVYVRGVSECIWRYREYDAVIALSSPKSVARSMSGLHITDHMDNYTFRARC